MVKVINYVINRYSKYLNPNYLDILSISKEIKIPIFHKKIDAEEQKKKSVSIYMLELKRSQVRLLLAMLQKDRFIKKKSHKSTISQ